MVNEKQDHMALIAIVGIVAIVGLFLMFFSQGTKGISTEGNNNLAGQAYAGIEKGEVLNVLPQFYEAGPGGSGGGGGSCYQSEWMEDPGSGMERCVIFDAPIQCPNEIGCSPLGGWK